MDKKSFGKRLNSLRKEMNLTSDQLSETLGITPVFLRQIESAARLPSVPKLVLICNALKVSPNYLLADSLELPGEKNSKFGNLDAKLNSLTPGQIELVTALVDALVKQTEK